MYSVEHNVKFLFFVLYQMGLRLCLYIKLAEVPNQRPTRFTWLHAYIDWLLVLIMPATWPKPQRWSGQRIPCQLFFKFQCIA
jgi:hypothetical protein